MVADIQRVENTNGVVFNYQSDVQRHLVTLLFRDQFTFQTTPCSNTSDMFSLSTK